MEPTVGEVPNPDHKTDWQQSSLSDAFQPAFGKSNKRSENNSHIMQLH
jgi:hypothetical protein